MPNVKGFTAAQMAAINAMIAAAITEAVATTVAAMQAAPALAATKTTVAKTVTQGKHDSFTQRLARGIATTNDVISKDGNWTADLLAELEVRIVSATVSGTG